MSINFKHTCEIIPETINANEELFLNEIFINRETIKRFIEIDTYQKLSNSTLTTNNVEVLELNGYKVAFVEFFPNYASDPGDTIALAFVSFKGKVRYFKCYNENGKSLIAEINIETKKAEVVRILESYSKEKFLTVVAEILVVTIKKIKLGVSNRHVHLNQSDLEELFGTDFVLEVDRFLVQKGDFASKSRVTIKTPFGSIDNVRVLGPIRDYTQVEISRTDAYKLKINPPIRKSGDLRNASLITIVGPKGSITKEACIIATRHIHATEADLLKYNLDPNKTYNVKINGEKSGIISDVHIKIKDNYVFELHLDTDDANAFLLKQGDELELF